LKLLFKYGADGIELDVQKTSDGKLVVSHDPNLKRLTGTDFSIRENTYNALLEHRIKGEKISLLEEVLFFCAKRRKVC